MHKELGGKESPSTARQADALYPSATLNALFTGSKAKEKQSSRLSGLPCPSREGKEKPAGPTRLRGLQQEASVWIQAQQLAELLHVFGAVLRLDHHHVSCTEPADAAGPAEHS